MATIIDGGMDTFRMLAYGESNRHVLEELEEMGRYHDERLIGRVRDSVESVRERMRGFGLSTIKRRAHAGLRKLATLGKGDIIRPLRTIGDLQHAPDRMLNWVMAEPETHRRYKRKEVEGYAHRYSGTTYQRNEDNPYYRRAMNGLWVDNPDSEETYYTEYWSIDGDEHIEQLIPDEQFDIQDTWRRLRIALDNMDDDPTSPYNAKL